MFQENVPVEERTLPNPFRDFCQVHGEFVLDVESDICFFEDGSKVTGRDSLGLTSWTDPPTDSYQLLLAKRLYIQIALDQEVKSFEEFQQATLTQASQYARNSESGLSSTPPPSADAKEQLCAGQKRIAELRDRLAHKDELLANTPQEKAKQQEYEEQRKNQNAARQQVNELMNLHP